MSSQCDLINRQGENFNTINKRTKIWMSFSDSAEDAGEHARAFIEQYCVL